MVTLQKNMGLIIGLLLGVFAYANTDVPAKASATVFVVKTQANVNGFLYFQGNIQPIRDNRVLSPIAGIVSKPLAFDYGDVIHKGDYLLSLTPSNQQNSYRSALLAYLRAKSAYSEAMTKYSGQQLLYKNKILARNEFQQYKNNLADQKLALQEALFNLKSAIEKVSSNSQAENSLIDSLSNLSLNDKKVYAALNRSFDEVKIHAHSDGVALLPAKQAGVNNSTQLHQGSVIKLNQVLLSIGDFSGLKVNVSVNEVSINRLHEGQLAEITGPAFPGIILKGKVSVISYQAKSASFSSGLPQFPVTISVAKLSTAEQKLIHAGMTAQVKIRLKKGAEMMIPLKAVTIKDGNAFVQKLVKGKAVKTAVKTGDTNLTQVAITQGLKPGDHIVVTD